MPRLAASSRGTRSSIPHRHGDAAGQPRASGGLNRASRTRSDVRRVARPSARRGRPPPSADDPGHPSQPLSRNSAWAGSSQASVASRRLWVSLRAPDRRRQKRGRLRARPRCLLVVEQGRKRSRPPPLCRAPGCRPRARPRVEPRQHEAVGGRPRRRQDDRGMVGRRPGRGDTLPVRRPAGQPHADAAGDAESVGVADDHDRRARNVDTDLDDAGRDGDISSPAPNAVDLILLVGRHPAVKDPMRSPRKASDCPGVRRRSRRRRRVVAPVARRRARPRRPAGHPRCLPRPRSAGRRRRRHLLAALLSHPLPVRRTHGAVIIDDVRHHGRAPGGLLGQCGHRVPERRHRHRPREKGRHHREHAARSPPWIAGTSRCSTPNRCCSSRRRRGRVGEGHAVLEQRMGPDDDPGIS